eukprot:CAMPEP_0184715418 /NCGR_PEP_ID=MMETSP0314-20130426/5351_1 /TAXON_ID=38298 /ORGANISM="Rhodella maculata, Strain CCMP 736" /LENGTH=149 /DNA_ID=CAMNT_0027178551 /DNA_START=93 /DNA_END=543 /DNA_ORIENTATION=-
MKRGTERVEKTMATYLPEMKKLMEKRLSVQLNGNRDIEGTLRGYDHFMNIVLDDCVEKRAADAERVPLGMVMVRGNSKSSSSVWSESEDVEPSRVSSSGGSGKNTEAHLKLRFTHVKGGSGKSLIDVCVALRCERIARPERTKQSNIQF